jgi:hypothetical protein
MPGASPFAVAEAGADYVQTWEVGGGRFATWGASAFNPHGMVGVTTATQLATPTVPPTMAAVSGASMGGPVQGGMSNTAAAGAAAPWSPRTSILPWVLVALIVGMFALHRLYYHR